MCDEQLNSQSYAVRLAVLEEQVRSQRREIESQAVEYERRLGDLNHAHQKQVADQAHYVSDDKFVGWQSEVNSWREGLTKQVTESAGARNGSLAVWGWVIQVVAQLIAAATIIALLKKP